MAKNLSKTQEILEHLEVSTIEDDLKPVLKKLVTSMTTHLCYQNPK